MNVESVWRQYNTLRQAGFNSAEALELVKADMQADAIVKLADAVTAVARIIDRKQF